MHVGKLRKDELPYLVDFSITDACSAGKSAQKRSFRNPQAGWPDRSWGESWPGSSSCRSKNCAAMERKTPF